MPSTYLLTYLLEPSKKHVGRAQRTVECSEGGGLKRGYRGRDSDHTSNGNAKRRRCISQSRLGLGNTANCPVSSGARLSAFTVFWLVVCSASQELGLCPLLAIVTQGPKLTEAASPC